VRELPAGVGREQRVSTGGEPVWRDTRLLLIGVVVLAMALAEGAANDWLPLIMVDGHGFDDALGSAVYVAFAASMTAGRFGGGWFLARFGRAAVLAASAVIGALGVTLVIFVDSQVVAALAVVLWGLGAALGFPVALSAAGDSGDNPTARVSLVATVGYTAFLVGPPVLGFLGENFGLRRAMIAVLGLLAVAALAAPALNRTRTPVRVG
jgi:fucose permease